ncbi:Stf0 family sulfotransferase [Halomonas sp. NPDC076908]|uniref:Stf0 family sulfotransferase n=1 Tax=Halomonas sp. NPDC076908 TaxID=3390567 RepID=UPI003D02F817
MNLYEDQFLNSHDFPVFRGERKNLILATTPRCGSHMLGHALYETGAFGFPLEYINNANVKRWKERLGVSDLDEVIEEIKNRRTSPNGVFSVKAHFSQMKNIGGMARFDNLFSDGKYLHIKRKDVLSQAVSFYIAKKTGKWISAQASVVEAEDVEYDFQSIDSCLKSILNHNAWWEYSIVRMGLDYCFVYYEDVLENPSSTLERISRFIGIDMPDKISLDSYTSKQSGSISEIFKDNFLKDCRAR